MHVNNMNDIVCTVKKTTVCKSHMLLSQYEFLYSSLVIKLVTQVSLVFMQLFVMGAASEVTVL